jgi:hypothetical protein
MPRQFLYSRYSYPVAAMPDPFSLGKESKKAAMRLGSAVWPDPEANHRLSYLSRRSGTLGGAPQGHRFP